MRSLYADRGKLISDITWKFMESKNFTYNEVTVKIEDLQTFIVLYSDRYWKSTSQLYVCTWTLYALYSLMILAQTSPRKKSRSCYSLSRLQILLWKFTFFQNFDNDSVIHVFQPMNWHISLVALVQLFSQVIQFFDCESAYFCCKWDELIYSQNSLLKINWKYQVI